MAIDFTIEDCAAGAGSHVVAVSGQLDLFTGPEFRQRVTAPITAGTDRVIVDLTQTTFLDSSSLGVLIGAHQRLQSRGGELVVACDSEAILSTFRITGLDGVFRLESSVEAALGGRAEAA